MGNYNSLILLRIPLLYDHKLGAHSIIDGHVGYFYFGLLNIMCL